ncbi:hypothetical protein C6P40_002983, partial [Pichia californica]
MSEEIASTGDLLSPKKHLRHANYNNTSALLGWISFQTETSLPIDNLNQLDDGTILLRLLDVVTNFEESEKLKPLYISSQNKISYELYNDISKNSISQNSLLPSPPVSPISDNKSLNSLSPSKKLNIKKCKVVNKELSRFQKLANIEIFMQWLNTSKLSLFNGISKVNNISDINIRGVSALDILEANDKLVPGLLWSIFWEFTMFPSNLNKNKQDLLWLWIINCISKFENKNLKEIESDINFKSYSWNDNGKLLIRLSLSLGIIKSKSEISNNELFNIIFNKFKIPKFLNIDDLNSEIVDEW